MGENDRDIPLLAPMRRLYRQRFPHPVGAVKIFRACAITVMVGIIGGSLGFLISEFVGTRVP